MYHVLLSTVIITVFTTNIKVDHRAVVEVVRLQKWNSVITFNVIRNALMHVIWNILDTILLPARNSLAGNEAY
jgi:hypothetical protein